ncbi:MAG: hypothetical protein ABSG43_01840 [Solirubrobacteraceae bacterium]|jgi:hypothetical protein
MEASTRETGRFTATEEQDPNLLWFAQQCQTNQVQFEALLRHAERIHDPELAAFFRRAQAVSDKLASAPH